MATRLVEDSDDETDEHFKDMTAKRSLPKSATAVPHQEVIIADTTVTTYQATLVWMCSQYIRFVRLRSSKAHEASETPESMPRLQEIRKLFEAKPHTPVPASPKSGTVLRTSLIWRILRRLALNAMSSQLTPRNAGTELFSDVASAYPEVRDRVFQYVVNHWGQVRSTEAWNTMRDLADAQALPAGAAHTALLLGGKPRPR